MNTFTVEMAYRRSRILFILACLMSVGALIGFVSYVVIQNYVTKSLLILSMFSMIFHGVLYFLYSEFNKIKLEYTQLFSLLIYLIFTVIAMYNPFEFLYMWAYLLYFPIIIGLIENEGIYKVWSVLYIILYFLFLTKIDDGMVKEDTLLLFVQVLLAAGSICVGYIIVKYLSFVRKLYFQNNEKQIKEHVFEVLNSLVPIVESKTHTTKKEILEMSELMKKMIKKMSNIEVKDWEIELLSLLHFVSRIEWPDYIFEKHDILTEYEYKIIQNHCFFGDKLLGNFESFENVKQAFLKHHQRKDGSGYPKVGNENHIPKLAQILGIVESYLSMIYPRPYHEFKTREDALLEIQTHEKWRVDPDIIDALTDVIFGSIRSEKK